MLPGGADASTTQAICEQIDSMESEITSHHARSEALRRQVRSLKSDLNARTAMGRLPIEVLAEVFTQGVALWVESYENASLIPRSNPWAGILHVCRSWREVALRSPRLWCTFAPTWLSFVRACLDNSGILPLTILAKPAVTPDSSEKRST